MPTERQIINAENLACKTVEFEGRQLTTLEAVVLDDELVAQARRTMRNADYERRAALHAAIWAAHKVVVAEHAAKVIAEARRVA